MWVNVLNKVESILIWNYIEFNFSFVLVPDQS